MDSALMNGPVRGEDVFVPMDWVIGGEACVGQGWHMLMECLAAGRAISLPALGAALQQTALLVMTGYGRVREQFGLPIGRWSWPPPKRATPRPRWPTCARPTG